MKTFLTSLRLTKLPPVKKEEFAKNIYEFFGLLQRHNPSVFKSWYIGNNETTRKKDAVTISQGFLLETLYKKCTSGKQMFNIAYSTSKTNQSGAVLQFAFDATGNNSSIEIELSPEIEFYQLNKNQQALQSLMIHFWKPGEIFVNGKLQK